MFWKGERMSFGENLDLIFFDTDLANESTDFEISFSEERCFFGIIKECPFEIGFISRTATASEFSEIL